MQVERAFHGLWVPSKDKICLCHFVAESESHLLLSRSTHQATTVRLTLACKCHSTTPNSLNNEINPENVSHVISLASSPWVISNFNLVINIILSHLLIIFKVWVLRLYGICLSEGFKFDLSPY